MKGAVIYGLDPNVITVRRSRLTYGIGILNRFRHDIDPKSKLIVRDDIEWCTDVFDKFVVCDQAIAVNECVQRSYTPVNSRSKQKTSILNIYCAKDDVKFVTDPGVSLCGRLVLDLEEARSTSVSSTNSNSDPLNNSNTSNTNSERSTPEISTSVNELNSSKSVQNSKTFPINEQIDEPPREIVCSMIFGDTEVKIFAIDRSTGQQVKAEIDFLMK